MERSQKMELSSIEVKPVNFDNFEEAMADMGMYGLFLSQQPFLTCRRRTEKSL